MSHIHLLFPPGESILQHHTWQEVGFSPHKFDFEASRVGWRDSETLSRRRRQSLNRRKNPYGRSELITHRKMRVPYSKTRSQVLRENSLCMVRRKCPDCGQLSTRYNCGHGHLISPSHWTDTQSEASTPHSEGESTQSPSTVDSNLNYPASPADSHGSSSTHESIYDQFRSGPFDHIFDGLRLTDQERDLIEELVRSDSAESQVQKKRAPTTEEIIQTLSQTTYVDFINYNFCSAADAIRLADVDKDRDEMASIGRDNNIDKVGEATPKGRTRADADDASTEGERFDLAEAQLPVIAGTSASRD